MLKYDDQFADFEISVLKEPGVSYDLFVIDASVVQEKQRRIFDLLEKDLLLLNADSFANQVHFQSAIRTPVQRWYPYREGYSTKLVNAFLKELGVTGNIFDPFSGSGTTLLAARQSNLQSFGIDVNPISVLVSRVENQLYSSYEVDLLKGEVEKMSIASAPQETFSTSFDLAGKVFNKEILNTLLHFKQLIREIESEKVRSLLTVAWLSIIEDVSNIKKEGNGIKYKNRKRTTTGYIELEKESWEKLVFPENKFDFVKNRFLGQTRIIISDIERNYGPCSFPPKIFEGNALDFEKFFSDEIEFTFFSPPYCNCFDYFEIHKVELWLGEFVNDKDDFRRLRNAGFRSNTNSLNQKHVSYVNENAEALISLLDPSKLWSSKIPNVIRGYFDDSHTLLKKLYLQTKKGGYVGIVVGSSAYSGVVIPTDILLADIAREIGFTVRRIFITRHLTTSSQQKQELTPLKDYLRESIVLLQK